MKLVVILVLLAFSTQSKSDSKNISVRVAIKNNYASISISDIQFPEEILNKELESGLPNDFLFVLSVIQGDRPIAVETVNYRVIYDLWDEDYRLIMEPGSKSVQKIYQEKQDLILELSRLKMKEIDIQLFTVNTMDCTLNIQTIFNPVKEDRIKKIQMWVDNERGSRQGAGTLHAASADGVRGAGKSNSISRGQASRGPRFRKLFDSILEQYTQDSDTVGQWRSEVISIKFQLSETVSEE